MIRLNETSEAAAEVPFTLPLASDPLTGLTGHTFTLGEVQIKLPDAEEWIDVAINKIREVGYGRFAARLTPAQCTAAGGVGINAEVTDTQPYRGVETIGELGGDIAEGGTGWLVVYLASSDDPVYGEPVLEHEWALGEFRVAWPDQTYTDIDPEVDNIIELGNGMYALEVTAAHTTVRGKAYYYALVDGAQRFENYSTILSATAFASEPVVEPPDVIPSPIVVGDVAYVDHVARAFDRLAQQFKDDDP